MIGKTHPLAGLLALGLAAALPSGTSAALSVMPNPAPAERAFTLTLLGVAGDACYNAFSRESVAVSGTRIDLRYTMTPVYLPAASSQPPVCPLPAVDAQAAAPIAANAPLFPMPPLKAGKYEVWATHVPECVYSGCKIAVFAESAGTLEVKADGSTGYFALPASASANQAFALQLLSYGFTCATAFDSLSATVAGGVITLSFYDRELPKGCGGTGMPYGPVFRIPALPPGTYALKADRLSTRTLSDAGTLQVTASARRGWYLKEHAVLAGKPFEMQLLREDVGNCKTSFSHETATVSAAGILANFVMETDSGRTCIMDVRPFGPSFSVQGLAAGVYPILPNELLPCQVSQPVCLLPVQLPEPTDTLVVMQTLAVRLSQLRAGAPALELRGGTASFILPEGGAGAWRAGLAAPDGRALAAPMAVRGATGDRVSIPVDGAPARGVSLLILDSPDGSRMILPIVRR